MNIEELIENFSFLDDWEDRYRYVIELGRQLEPLDESRKTDENKVPGCASQVWISTTTNFTTCGPPTLSIRGDSDAHIVRGLVAILITLCTERSAPEILKTDPVELFERLGLKEHLTPQRSNGFRSMVSRIHAEARVAMERASALT